MFYNEKQKIRYLESEDNRFEETTLAAAKIFFNGSSRVEFNKGIDLASFNRSQVFDLLKSYNSRSKGYYKGMCLIFSDYYNWCLNEGLIDRSNVTDWYDYKLSNSIIDEVLPMELIEGKYFKKEYVNECIEKIVDISDKFVFYAPFMGIKGDDLINLRIDDLNEKRNAVQLVSGKTLQVDDLFIYLMKETDSARRYYPNGVVGIDNKYSYNEYIQSIYVLKMCRGSVINKQITTQVLSTKMKVIKKQIGNKLISAAIIYQNGLISYIKEKYEERGITLRDAIFKEINKKLYFYDKETAEYIEEFGANKTVKMLRMELKDIIKYYE